jgi:hypothetical protein
MKNCYLKNGIFALIILLFAGFSSETLAQEIRYVDVNPGIGTLNDAINGDTTATGARVDTFNTVYRLKRVEDIYYISALISNIDYPLTVVAEDGDGPRPYLALKTDQTGTTASYCFRPKGDITLRSLHLTNMDDLGAVSQRIIRASADDIRITIDDCWLDDAHQAGIRLDNKGMKLYITNTVFSNIGNPADPDNGRGIDDRGNSIDTLIIEDCTWYNFTHSVMRDGGGHIKYCKINNSTFANVGRRGFGLGNIAEFEFTNNILHNVAYIVQDSGSTQAVFEIDEITQELLDMGLTQSLNISNNSIFLDTSLIASYLNDTTVATPLFDPTGEVLVEAGTAEGFYYENVSFENPPGDQGIIDQLEYQMNPDLLVENTPDWVLPDPPNTIYHLDVPFSFNYANTIAQTGGTDGGQLGDRNWIASPTVGIARIKTNQGVLSAYPTPAESHVNIAFSVASESFVSIDVYNLSGRKVYNLTNEMYPAGSHEINWDFNGKLNTGIYLLRMNAGGSISGSKMIVK